MISKEFFRNIHESKSKYKEYSIHKGKVPLQFIEQLKTKQDVDLNYLCHFLDKIPSHLFHDLKSVRIENLPEFEKRSINALYRDSTIYVSNFQDNTYDMLDDIVHELAHSVEVNYENLIYGDGHLRDEFLDKRKKILFYIEAYEIGFPKGINKKSFLNINFDINFDNYLYKHLGYPRLDQHIKGIFPSSYSVTSLREYFAVGFTDFYIHGGGKFKNTCPVLYSKISKVANLREKNK